MSEHTTGCEDWRRLTQALQQARIAFFEYRPALSPGRHGTLTWTGTRFGIDRLGVGSMLPDLLDAVVPADRPTLLNVLSLDRPGSARSGEFRIVRLDGGLIDLSCDAYAEPDGQGGIAVVFGMVQDVTAQRRFENELATVAHRNHMLLAVIDACPIGIAVHDATAVGMPLIYANRRFTQLSGYEQAEVIGRDCSFLASPDTEPEALGAIGHGINRGETIETRITSRRRDGSPFVTRLTLAPIHDGGRLSGFIGLLYDLTHEAERQIAERHRQKMEALGRMTGGVRNELNNLLQPVALLAQDLLDRGMIDDAGRSHLEIVLDCCLKARQIIGDMLAFSRPARQRAERWEPRLLLEESLRLVRQALPQGVTIAVHAANDAPSISAERTAFTQVLLNLASNAAAAMDGKGEVAIRLNGLARADGTRWAQLRVTDSGCGMDQATLERAFEPFFTTKPVGQGTGLGLSVVYGLVGEMGGTIALESVHGEGTTATALLPAYEGDARHGIDTGH